MIENVTENVYKIREKEYNLLRKFLLGYEMCMHILYKTISLLAKSVIYCIEHLSNQSIKKGEKKL